MKITLETIDQIKIGGWAYYCCDCDLQEVDDDFIQTLKKELEDWDDPWYWHYFETKEDALAELGI